MKQFIILLIAGLFLGCVDVKIKSQIPKKTYYDLDTKKMDARECKQFITIGMGEISSIAVIDNKNIITKKSNGETSSNINIQWVDNPKSMLKSMLIKQGYEKCINFEEPSLKKITKILFVDLLFLGFIDGGPSIEFVYKISDDQLNIIDMGILKQSQQTGDIADLQGLAQQSIDALLSLLIKE